ncbi:MAG: flagellar basal body P-ring formation protein FlgA [Proteobacteria bacterium]|nr:flagellar basal body P-ring formation protein FlgA [Pseudomonadota bacterium]
MKKLVFALLAVVLLLPAVSAAGGKSAALSRSADQSKVVLRESVRVKSKLVRLGDLFSATGEKADIAVAYAPVPGKRAIFDSRWLYRVARAYGLDWRPLGLQDQIVVERESQMITREEIEDHIRAALIDRGADPNTKVELSNRMMRLYVASDVAASVGVEDVSYEPRTGRFTAILVAPAGDPGATRTRVTGRLHREIDVPVPARRILANEVITERDINWVKIRQNRLPRGVIVDINELIGKSPKRWLRAGIPVRVANVQPPILVPKGSLVTIYLKVPRMMLTAQGKALENGSDGDVIRINNTQTNKVIEAEVTGVAKVAVLPPGKIIMN